MGRCLEFGRIIEDGCAHSMVAGTDSCHCPDCGAQCTGLYKGCEQVWARGGQPFAELSGNGSAGSPASVRALDPVIVTARNAPIQELEPVASEPLLHRPLVRVLLTLGVVLAIVGGFTAFRDGGRSEANGPTKTIRATPPTPTTAVLPFDPVPVADGVQATREWRLDGRPGDRFTATISFTNSGASTAHVVYDEVVPKELAANVDAIAFDPAPVILEADPVFRYEFDLPAGLSVTMTYRVDVAPDGARRSRLEAWASALELLQAQRAAAAEQAAAQARLYEALAAQRAAEKPTTPPKRTTTSTRAAGTPTTSPPADPVDPPADPVDPPADPVDPPADPVDPCPLCLPPGS